MKTHKQVLKKEDDLFNRTYYTYRTHLYVEKDFLEKHLGLMELLRIIQRLSKSRGVRAKQLFPYYEKVGIGRLRPLLRFEQPELPPSTKTVDYSSDICVHVGSKEFYGGFSGEYAFLTMTRTHLKRCLFILKEKGYLEIDASHQSGSRWQRSETYYLLTPKALKRLEKELVR